VSTSPTIDLDAYFARIGYVGPRSATLDTLHAITGLHATTIPFENLDILLNRPIRLDPDSLQQKLIFDHRGGYCFEQNGLLLLVLTALGFQVTPLSARVRLQQARDDIPPRTHLFLQVDVDGEPWLTDVGIGALSLTAAIQRHHAAGQLTPHEPRRILHEDGRFFHQADLGEGWVDVYEFTGEAMPLVDRELANWWTSTNPGSRFRQNLTVARAEPDGRRKSLRNGEYTLRRGAEVLEQRTIVSAEELHETLARHFGLRFPAGTRFGPPGSPWPT
jgi:N-hydroxyarylamine O-acetyltransferase